MSFLECIYMYIYTDIATTCYYIIFTYIIYYIHNFHVYIIACIYIYIYIYTYPFGFVSKILIILAKSARISLGSAPSCSPVLLRTSRRWRRRHKVTWAARNVSVTSPKTGYMHIISISICVWICVCVYMCMCMCMYIYMCMCVYGYVYNCMCMCMCMCVYVCVCV